MPRSLVVATKFAALALLGACSSHGSIQTAHTVGKGNFQGAIEPGVVMIPNTVTLSGAPGTLIFPSVNFAGRYGVTEKFDLGARLGSSLYEITTKFQFTDDGGTIISLAPDATFAAFAVNGAGGGFFRFQTPLLIGLPAGENQFIVGPNWVFNSAFGGGGGQTAAVTGMGPGVQVAYSAKLADSFRLHPELSVKFPGLIALGTTSGTAGTASAGATTLTPVLGVNLGLLFGGN